MIKKHKGKLFFGCVVLLLLVLSFFAGEPPQKTEELFQKTQQETVLQDEQASVSPKATEAPEEPKQTEEPAAETQEPPKEMEPEQASPSPETPREAPEERVEPEKSDAPSCTLLVRCDAIFKHLDDLKDGKEALLPKNGIILKAENISFTEGESVFDVLRRELPKNGIHFEFTDTPMYNSVYIEGIANLYEFDCGDYSGWMYRVNGVKPTYGCSQYILKDKDNIEFFYSCNLFGSES